MRMLDLIYKKRNGYELTKDEINFFVKGVTDDEFPDYQVSAFLMAVYFQKMNERETADLTEAMMHSGDIISLKNIDGIKVDKHSTGGVGDKTTIVLAPMVAACDVPVAKMSGRGLGHTGGTIDKLEAFKNLETEMSIEAFINRVNDIKLAVAGQTANLAPADKKLYALRDVTGTVDNISLIASSIMSKKLASGADAIVLDVKYGSGAFMKSLEEAKKLAESMVSIGKKLDRQVVALVTDMDQPLGCSVGNTLEVLEAIDVLKGNGPEDLKYLCIELGAQMLLLAEKTDSLASARELMQESISNGKALAKLKEFVQEQNGDTQIIDHPDAYDQAHFIREVTVDGEGYVVAINAENIGKAALVLGAGRTQKDSIIDLSVGVVLKKKRGDFVTRGETVAVIHANVEDAIPEAIDWIEKAYSLRENAPESIDMVQAVIK
ncbi:MAG: pyrimidine-nucleoside phosphorylase [Tindallia sp. MSAO_Bac2]|nr:MAG: pyrimidine-nucleoside phosphorylase [Tindallia sp. MSAO_Bac2]